MSKKDMKRQNGAREPWEQSIYDTEGDSSRSRVEKRQHKKGNTVFLTILVVLLLLIIALPVGTYLWIVRDNPNGNKPTAASSSVVSSTKESSSTSTTSSSSESQSSTPESTESTPESTPTPENSAEGEPEYATVLDGEGFKQVAERNGVTVDQILELNGMSTDTVLHPGDSLRIK